MYPFASLPDNLTAFCARLRRDCSFRIGPGEVADAARALAIVPLADVQIVRDALRPILSGTAEDAAIFDRAFTEFFLPGPIGEPQEQTPFTQRTLGGGSERPTADEPGSRVPRTPTADTDDRDRDDIGAATPLEADDRDAEGPAPMIRASYSPLETESADVPDPARVDAAWLDAARRLVRHVRLGLSRRWKPARRGRRFDARRVMRASLQTGGEVLAPRWQHRQRRAPRFVVLIDGSRSMSTYTPISLRMATALAQVTRRVELFTFSTALQRVTADLRLTADATPAWPRHRRTWNRKAWGGGTSIGACLRAFVRGFGDHLLAHDTIVIITSDGLDLGEPDTLRTAMQDLRRRAAAVVWLNPLVDTPGYAPTARGMSIARPYVTTFASANDLAAFTRLARTIRIRERG